MSSNPLNHDMQRSWAGPPVAVLWDQSLVWALLCVDTLGELGIPYHLLTAADVRGGALAGYRILLVPGGWALHKVRALGEAGRNRISRFIDAGGSYIGFCGGAGMALSSPPGLYLVPMERMPLNERLPSASGEIWVEGIPGHPAWNGLPPRIPVSIWWPSQFNWQPLPRSLCLASYKAPGQGFRVADLRVFDFGADAFMDDWEKVYGINLDPKRLIGHPAVFEVRRGKGRLVLSYAHLETPGDRWGNLLLVNLLAYLDERAKEHLADRPPVTPPGPVFGPPPGPAAWKHIEGAKAAGGELIDFGAENLFWSWRKPWLLQWRRGIRGLEYGALAVSLDRLIGLKARLPRAEHAENAWSAASASIERDTRDFCRRAKRLLLEEKLATQRGALSKIGKVNERVDALRSSLFGPGMNHGGLCRSLFDQIDGMLLDLLRMAGKGREGDR